jgi:ribosome-binding protein aMBF1 (putative translation factor)
MSPKPRQRCHELLQKHRKLARLSVTMAAAKVGVSEAMIRYWERGDGLPHIQHQAALAEVLSIDLSLLATMIAQEAAHEPLTV